MAALDRIPPEIPEDLDRLAAAIVDAVGAVRKKLGAGLFEKLYAAALAHELGKRGLRFRREASFPVSYDGIQIGSFRADFLVEERIILELKAVADLHPIHIAQTLTYLHGSGCALALLVNCHALPLGSGIRRFVNSSVI